MLMNRLKSTISVLSLLLIGAILDSNGAIVPTRADQDNLFLGKFMLAFEAGKISQSDVTKIKHLMNSVDKNTSLRATGLFAQYLDEVEDKPLDALQLLAPQVLKTDVLNDWKKALQTNKIKAKDEPGAKVRTLPAEFPPFSIWKQDQPEMCVQVCKILTVYGKYETALRGFDTIGRTLQGLPQILAAEAGGDVHFGMNRHSQALDFYNFALKMSAYIKGNETYYNEIATELNFLSGRIKRKIEKVNKILEEEKYGAGFVAYRDARRLELSEKDYACAAVKYQTLQSMFPSTVYAEAGRAYEIGCLLALSAPDMANKVESRIDTQKASIKTMQGTIKQFGPLAPRKIKQELDENLKEQFRLLTSLEAIPVGVKAEKQAIKLFEEFRKSSEYGIYRGEVMLRIADHALESKGDVDEARKWYGTAAKWFDEVKTVDAALERFQVPDKARTISAPPPREREVDRWANVSTMNPSVENIFNRQTCTWYWSFMRKKVALKQGLVEFIDGRYKEAEESWKMLREIDPFFVAEEKKGWGSVVDRLMWNIKFNDGCLYATPAEMKSFTVSRMRVAVFLADLAYENEEHAKAENLYKQILSGKYGKLNNNQEAYLTYALANCCAYQWKDSETARLLSKFNTEFKKTPSTPRAWLMMGNRATRKLNPGSASEKAGFGYYSKLVKEFPESKEAESALYYWGWLLLEGKRPVEAQHVFKTYLRDYATGKWAKAANSKLNDIEVMLKKKG
jgi:tetratricopeptide (TPR) repeat protein